MAEGTDAGNLVLLQERTTINGGKLGFATLNSPRSLNALSLDMIRLLDAQLQRWAEDPQIVCVILSGSGEKGLCDPRPSRSCAQSTGA